jgi:cytoskeletal protein RodZ
MEKENVSAEEMAQGEAFGEYLARERRLRNISLEEISQRTKISMKVLQALEASRWEELPADVYVRGFLRSYARYVGLDENEVLLRYEDQRPKIQKPNVRKPFPTEKRGRGKRIVWGVILILAFAALAYIWIVGRKSGERGPLGLPSPFKGAQGPQPAGPTVRPQPMPPPPQQGN